MESDALWDVGYERRKAECGEDGEMWDVGCGIWDMMQDLYTVYSVLLLSTLAECKVLGRYTNK